MVLLSSRLIVLFLFINTLPAFAQMFPYYHYTVDDGLPHSVVYSILQDKKGFFWFATDNGISKYDGETFTNFSVADGLLSNSVISLVEDSTGKIFMTIYGKGINYIDSNKVYLYSKSLPKDGPINTFLVQDSNGFYVRKAFSDIAKIRKTRFSIKVFINESIYGIIKTVRENTILVGTHKGLYRKISGDSLQFVKMNAIGERGVWSLYQHTDSTVWIGSKGEIIVLKNLSIQKIISLPLNEEITGILVDAQNRIWFAVYSKGIFLWENGIVTSIGKKFNIEKTEISRTMLRDNNGTIWFAPFGKGVFSLYNTYINNYSVDDGLSHNYIQTIIKDNYGRILIGTLNGINSIHHNSVTQPKNNDENYEVRCFFIKKNNTIFMGGSSFEKHKKPIFSYDKHAVYKKLPLISAFGKNDKKIFGGTWANFVFLLDEKGDTLKKVPLYKNFSGYIRTKKIYTDTYNRTWFGTTSGLCQYINEDSVYCYEGATPLTGIIEDITEDSTHTVWVVSNKGVMSYTNNEWKPLTLPEYTITGATSLQFDSQNHLWLGTLNGLYYYDGKTVRHFTKYSGLIANNINTLFYDKEENILWVGTTEGISKINITQYHASVSKPIKPIISKVMLRDTTIYEPTSIKISWKKNRAKIYFAGLYFYHPKSVLYEYKFSDEEHWQKAQGNMVELLNIDYGATEIFMRAKIENGEWSAPTTLLIEKETPWWASISFYIFCGITVIGIGVLGVQKRITKIKLRAEEKAATTRAMQKLEYKTILAAMLNPHFVFNSLNSIQYLVNHNKKRAANDYLTQLSKFIRTNLNVANKNIIPLKQELQSLHSYLQLEKLRFDDTLEFTIEVASTIDTEEIYVPNIIIQPFVENSIKHGILPARKKGVLCINITEYNKEYIKITIEDNGVGIEASKKLKNTDTSMGISIMQNRLQLLYKEKYHPITIREKKSPNNTTTGTIVEIILSKHLEDPF